MNSVGAGQIEDSRQAGARLQYLAKYSTVDLFFTGMWSPCWISTFPVTSNSSPSSLNVFASPAVAFDLADWAVPSLGRRCTFTCSGLRSQRHHSPVPPPGWTPAPLVPSWGKRKGLASPGWWSRQKFCDHENPNLFIGS